MSAVFRSSAFWKSAIMTLPDNSFFELLRSVFGKIKTPFNKQVLVDDLESFLLRDDIQKTISCYIDQDDARLVSAVAALGEPVPGELESFFSGELGYAELHDMVINLEERFILYRFREQGLSRLALNPLLEPVLAPFAENHSLLFPSAPADEVPPLMTPNGRDAAALNDRILAGLLSFAAESGPFFRNEGEIRKRIADAGSRIFPGIDLGPVIGGLRALGLFRAEGDRLFPDYRRFSAFEKLSPLDRMEYCAAGIYCFSNSKAPVNSPYLLRAQIKIITAFVRQFISSLEPERVYPVKTLKRLADVLEHGGPEPDRKKTGPEGFMVPPNHKSEFRGGLLIEALEKTGLLVPAGAECRRLAFPVTDPAGADTAGDGKTPVIALDTSFSCLVYPEITFADAVSLASALSVREAGTTVRFELTRDSAVRAFDRGISAGAILDRLKRLSAGRINETLIWTLNDWEKRYSEVSFHRGLILRLSPERRYLAETEPLVRFIRETLAEGIYLLPETAEKAAADALQKAGVDIVARRTETAADTDSGIPFGKAYQFFPPVDSFAPRSGKAAMQLQNQLKTLHAGGEKNDLASSAPALIDGFHSILKQMRYGKAEQDELAARIDRRLILCESQLRDASVRYEKLEAKGLDYVGKAIIAKQAIALQSPLELVWPGPSAGGKGQKLPDREKERIFGIPRTLEKEKGENILVISPLDGSGGEPLRIPLGKISLLRRIKKSIFENT